MLVKSTSGVGAADDVGEVRKLQVVGQVVLSVLGSARAHARMRHLVGE